MFDLATFDFATFDDTGIVVTVPVVVPDAAPIYGGVGHFLVELENARQLARITRKTPQPIDRTTKPQFKPVGSPPMAPPAPAIDLQAIQNQRASADAASQAATIKRRRQEEELLLLAS